MQAPPQAPPLAPPDPADPATWRPCKNCSYGCPYLDTGLKNHGACCDKCNGAANEHGTKCRKIPNWSAADAMVLTPATPAASAAQPGLPDLWLHCPAQCRTTLVIEVAYGENHWWAIPDPQRSGLIKMYLNDRDAGYTWDFHGKRKGAFRLNGEPTSISRYAVHFELGLQRNMDNQRLRSARLLLVESEADSAEPPLRLDDDRAAQLCTRPIIEVATSNDTTSTPRGTSTPHGTYWWTMPEETAAQVLDRHDQNPSATNWYVWDWGAEGHGSYAKDGDKTSLRCYVINLKEKYEMDIITRKRRKIRIAWTGPHAYAQPRWTGDIEQDGAFLTFLKQIVAVDEP